MKQIGKRHTTPYQKRSNLKAAIPTSIPPYIWEANDIEVPVSEYRFTLDRRWRADFAWPNKKVCVEIEGGIYNNGRHIRPRGFINDMEKYNHLSETGWLLLRYSPSDIKYSQIRRVLSSRQVLNDY